jgi:hypothetical protein
MATLIKISDDMFEGRHPNGINEGFKEIGGYITGPIVGERYKFNNLTTSTVTEITEQDDNCVNFKTQNSTYKIIK